MATVLLAVAVLAAAGVIVYLCQALADERDRHGFARDQVKTLRREIKAANDLIHWFETRQKEASKLRKEFTTTRKQYRAIEDQYRVLCDRFDRVVDEHKWLQAVLHSHGLGHVLSRDPESKIWDLTNTPRPPGPLLDPDANSESLSDKIS